MAAGDVFKREQDEDQRGNFQQPEREHGHCVGDEELQQRGEQERERKNNRGRSARGKQKITAETENENRQRNECHHHERHAPGKKQAQPIPEIINRLEQELADVALADVGGDLPVVLVDRREHVHHGDEQVVKNRFRERPAGMLRAADLPPEREHGEQRDEAEQRPRQVIDAIGQVVLQPDADDVQVFFHSRGKFNRAKPNCESKCKVNLWRRELEEQISSRRNGRDAFVWRC